MYTCMIIVTRFFFRAPAVSRLPFRRSSRFHNRSKHVSHSRRSDFHCLMPSPSRHIGSGPAIVLTTVATRTRIATASSSFQWHVSPLSRTNACLARAHIHTCTRTCIGSKSHQDRVWPKARGGRWIAHKNAAFFCSLMGFTYNRRRRRPIDTRPAARLMNDLTVSARRKSYFAGVRTLNLYLCVCEFVLFGS